MLDLGALEPDEDLDWHAVREVTECIPGRNLTVSAQPPGDDCDAIKFAAARLCWRRGHPTGSRSSLKDQGPLDPTDASRRSADAAHSRAPRT